MSFDSWTRHPEGIFFQNPRPHPVALAAAREVGDVPSCWQILFDPGMTAKRTDRALMLWTLVGEKGRALRLRISQPQAI